MYKVLIVGAGNIGAFFDNPGSKDILTHAHAFTKHRGFTISGFVDVDLAKASKAAKIWGGQAFKNVDEAFTKEAIDIVCVAAPDEAHYEILKKLSCLPVKFVFTEKPLTKTASQAEDILKKYKTKKIPVLVDYMRRFVPEFEKIRFDIKKGSYGKYLTGTGYYGKGILHNGSHMLDLLMYFLGDIKDVNVLSRDFDAYHDDPSVEAVLTMNNQNHFFLQHVDCQIFSVFEMDLIFEKKRFRVTDLGFKLMEYKIKENKLYKGYRNMVEAKIVNTALGNSLYFCVDNIYQYLRTGASLKCSIKDACKVIKVCEHIKGGLIGG